MNRKIKNDREAPEERHVNMSIDGLLLLGGVGRGCAVAGRGFATMD